jgi:heparan-alpha-glucosaminide N-acetyltransferase
MPQLLHEPSNRLASIDAYRGFTMLAMASAGLSLTPLLESHELGWLAHQLDHETWEGCTAWDLIQPSFMFLVGVAMPFSFSRRQKQGASWKQQFSHALSRCFLLALIGMFLDSYDQQIITVQFIRVLQQIALAYLLVFLVLHLSISMQLAVLIGILFLHPALYVLYAQSQGMENAWPPGNNLGTKIDQSLNVPWLLSYHVNFIPVSTGHYATLNALSSSATILSGVLVGRLLRAQTSPLSKIILLAGLGMGCLYLGLELTRFVPMVKRLWTSSFAVYAGGWTLILMGGFYAIVDGLKFQKWAVPLVVVGMNSIAIYVFSGLAGSNIKRAIEPFLHLFDFPREIALFSLALAALGVKWLFCYWLYRHKIFMRV